MAAPLLLDLPNDMLAEITDRLDALSQVTLFLTCKDLHTRFTKLYGKDSEIALRSSFNEIVAVTAGRVGDARLLVFLSNYFSPLHSGEFVEKPKGMFGSIFRMLTCCYTANIRPDSFLHDKLKDTRFIETTMESAMQSGKEGFIKNWLVYEMRTQWTPKMVMSCAITGDMNMAMWALAKLESGHGGITDKSLRYTLVAGAISIGFVELFEYIIKTYPLPTMNRLSLSETDLLVSKAAEGGKLNRGNSLEMFISVLDNLGVQVTSWFLSAKKAIRGGCKDTVEYIFDNGSLLEGRPKVGLVLEAIRGKDVPVCNFVQQRFFEKYGSMTAESNLLYEAAKSGSLDIFKCVLRFPYEYDPRDLMCAATENKDKRVRAECRESLAKRTLSAAKSMNPPCKPRFAY